MLSADLLQHIAIARLILFGSVIGLLFLMKILRPNGKLPQNDTLSQYLPIWSLALGLVWALSAASILLPAHTLLWGNQGDETFQIAFMERVIAGEPFSDFFYEGLSIFYPPLYFWIFGTLGRLFDWDGISAAQWGTILTYAFLPLCAVIFAKLCTWTKREQYIALLLSIATLLLLPVEALLLKPYEAAAALFSVLWLFAFYKLLQKPSQKLRVILGITGGLIFLLYYFWFILLVPAMIGLITWHICHLEGDTKPTKGPSRRFFGLAGNSLRMTMPTVTSFVVIGLIVTLISSPFLLPYLHNLITLGQENFQAYYFFPSDIALYAPWISWTLAGALIILSVISFLKKDKLSDAQKVTIALALSIFLWHIVQLSVLAMGGKPIMLSKPFLFLGTMTLFLPAVEWITEIVEQKLLTHPKAVRRALAAGILLTAPLLPHGTFLEDTKVQAQLEQNKLPKTSTFVAENIRVFVPDYKNRTWLISGLQDLNGMLPLTHYLAWNPHFSHPSAHWETRLNNVKKASELNNASEVTKIFDELGIDALLFYKAKKENENIYYPFFYEEDAWPNGTESKELRFKKEAINVEEWKVAHEDNEWIIFIRKNDRGKIQ